MGPMFTILAAARERDVVSGATNKEPTRDTRDPYKCLCSGRHISPSKCGTSTRGPNESYAAPLIFSYRRSFFLQEQRPLRPTPILGLRDRSHLWLLVRGHPFIPHNRGNPLRSPLNHFHRLREDKSWPLPSFNVEAGIGHRMGT